MFVETFWGRGASLAIAAFAAIAAIGCLNGWVLMQGEIPLGMARSGLTPAILARTNGRDVPTFAILISSIVASFLALSGAVPGLSGALTFMLQLTTAATVWFYFGACAAALALGVARPLAVIGMLFSAWVLYGSGMEALLLSIVLMFTAIPLYWLRPRRAQQPA
jgi:APA family basic amino acid/polyamine antiporter